jgi:hypothetical protein
MHRGGDARLYTLDVYLIAGPVTREFARKNRIVSRTIQIRGNQTLEDLHEVIFFAFDRMDEHMYEFQIGGRRPMDPRARRYGVASRGILSGRESAGDARRTTIGSLGLRVDDVFGYWFDFGDDWWHEVNVVAIEKKATTRDLPRVVKRVRESPPQYPRQDDEE